MNGAPLHPAWREYRRRWWIAVGILLTYLPVAGAGAILLKKATGSETPGAVLAVSWMLAYLAAVWRLSSFRCPSCGEQFHYRKRWFAFGAYNPFARRCVHCGLPKWQAPA
jgi:predicted RNA-binding Zn-ribbon protein involved in translation (DUF1610 family)